MKRYGIVFDAFQSTPVIANGRIQLNTETRLKVLKVSIHARYC